MVVVFIFYLLFIFMMFGVVAVLIRHHAERLDRESEKEFLDEDGYHVYYERSLIEKRDFLRRNPGGKSLRSFRRLFSLCK